MGITLGQTVSITLARTIQKCEVCEHCGTAFQYEMHRVVKSEATNVLNLDDAGARTQADYEAAVKLHKQLSKEVDAVPCPQCGLFQKEMVRKLRRQYRSGMKTAAFVCLLLGILSGSFWLLNEVDARHVVTRWITGIGGRAWYWHSPESTCHSTRTAEIFPAKQIWN